MYRSEHQKRIRYGETDKMGYLYYGNYAMLYEIGRSETIRALGTSYREMEDIHKVMLPVVHVESRFLQPIRYDELITIGTEFHELPTKMITFHHDIVNEAGQVCHKATVKLFFVDMVTNQRVSCPDYLNEKIKGFF